MVLKSKLPRGSIHDLRADYAKDLYAYFESRGDVETGEIYYCRKELVGNARMKMKAGLTFACMNLKKLAKILDARERQDKNSGFCFILYKKYGSLYFYKKNGAGAKLRHQLCLQSEVSPKAYLFSFILIPKKLKNTLNH